MDRYPATEQQEWSCRKARWITTIPPLARGTRKRVLRSRGCVSNARRAALCRGANATSCCGSTPASIALGGGRVRCEPLSLQAFCVRRHHFHAPSPPFYTPKALCLCGHLRSPLFLFEGAALGACICGCLVGFKQSSGFLPRICCCLVGFKQSSGFLLRPCRPGCFSVAFS